MIAPVTGLVGTTVSISGYASDYDRRIMAVEFSMDDGKTWTEFDTSTSDPSKWVKWTFSRMFDEPGSYTLLIRALNELGDYTPEPDSAHIIIDQDTL